jgi:hypothetical protein
MKGYGEIFGVIRDRHEQALNKPRLFKKKKWVHEIKAVLVMLQLAADKFVGGDPRKSLSKMLIAPLGCVGVGFQTGKLFQGTEAFVRNYDRFLDHGDPRVLEKADKNWPDIADRFDKVASALDDLMKTEI